VSGKDKIQSVHMGVLSDSGLHAAPLCLEVVHSTGSLLCMFVDGGQGNAHSDLLFVKGTIGLTKQTILWLQRRFDCSIGPLYLPPYRINEIAAFLVSNVEATAKPVEFLYALPDAIKTARTVTITFPSSSLRAMGEASDRLAAGPAGDPLGAGDGFSLVRGYAIIEAMAAQYDAFFRMDVAAMRLQRVGTPGGMVASDGKIKVFSADTLGELIKVIAK
jgi:hypothetical protein